ncbi:GHKL domain-containing protein [Dialister sp.]|jgi:signal transduction histidine kinase|uniref:GHKL domain-containing protein n=1 Tax=Dialister sp. TaxID=1955814 RepID=UPI003A5C2930
MENAFSLALCTMVIHLAGRFIWYESFRDYISKRKRNYAALSFLALGLVNLLLFTYLFSQPGRLIPMYKTALTLGWLPYFLLSFLWLPRMVAQQVFVLGMQGLWISFLHTLSMISVMAMVQDLSLVDRLTMELIGYMVAFILTFPITLHIFRHMCPSPQLINEKSYGYYIAFLPIIISLMLIPISMDDKLWSPDKLAARFISVFAFYALYRYVYLEAQDLEGMVLLRSADEIRDKAIRFFQNYTILVQDTMKQGSILRHDVRHNIHTIYKLVAAGKQEEALSLLETYDDDLEKSVVHPYCLNPYINAIVSVYLHKAKNAGIPVSQRISFPNNIPGLQEELGLLLANLLENAIRVSEKEDPRHRFLRLNLQQKGSQVILAVENYCEKPLHFDEEGYPQSSEPGRGTGMASVHRFIKRYGGFKNFTWNDGIVRFEIYFRLPAMKK